MSKNNDFKALLFIGQDTLNEIRENKGHQRNITYQFVFIAVALFGLSEFLKIGALRLILAMIIGIYGGATLYFLYRFQTSLAYFRKRLSEIWADESFKFAFDNSILTYPNESKKEYYSFQNNFWGYTFIYMFMVFVVTLTIILYLLIDSRHPNQSLGIGIFLIILGSLSIFFATKYTSLVHDWLMKQFENVAKNRLLVLGGILFISIGLYVIVSF